MMQSQTTLASAIRSVKSVLRPVKWAAIDTIVHGRHLLRVARGQDLWLRATVKRRAIRLGFGDGEWWVGPDGLGPGNIVYSFGIGFDISFDLAMIQRFGSVVHAFDPTPLSLDWLSSQSLPNGFHHHLFGIGIEDGVVDFVLPVNHGVSFTMALDVPSKMAAACQIYRLSTILERLGHDRIDVLKLDVEGAEYDLVDDLVAVAPRVGQLLIEFHHWMIPGQEGLDRTQRAIHNLQDGGYSLYHVSPRGHECSFVSSRTL
jgi:FkbM family methyltransferase